ncbi:mitochondrial ribosomal protein subunit L31 [Alternaria alternata]|nr:mitochondrial ribosomal protein subunit L31 [Alternaria alternata]
MFGPFRLTNPLSGGLLWKIPWRLSRHQKYRHRERLRHVDSVVGTLDTALRRMGQSMKKVERWKMEMPTEQEMLPKDKYTVFDRKVKRYRKGIHTGKQMMLYATGSHDFGDVNDLYIILHMYCPCTLPRMFTETINLLN